LRGKRLQSKGTLASHDLLYLVKSNSSLSKLILKIHPDGLMAFVDLLELLLALKMLIPRGGGNQNGGA